MGANVQLELERHGFYPAGGGRIHARIHPRPRLDPLVLDDAAGVSGHEAIALYARLPEHVAERELGVVRERLGWTTCSARKVRSPGPGNALLLHVMRGELCETVTAVGERGVRAEVVAGGAVEEMQRYLDSNVPVGEHLADQLIIPLALAGGSFRCVAPSLHTTTNIDVVATMLGKRVEVIADAGAYRICQQILG
jgi:RNA 3'-terminal phosphate cyclase (ATP)